MDDEHSPRSEGSRGSRTALSARNAVVSVAVQIGLLGLTFVSRTVFIHELGVEYLGLNTVFVSILAVLSIADLGLTGAVMFALYGPLASGDDDRVASILALCARLFRFVAGAVAVLGLPVLFLLDRLVEVSASTHSLQVYYLVLLANSVVGYLLAYRVVVLHADQRIYLVKTYSFVFEVLRHSAQIAVLVLWQNYLAFVVIQLATTVLLNGWIYFRVGRMYPFLHGVPRPLGADQRRDIYRTVRAALVYRAGGVILHNSDPILISLLLGTVVVGQYANYLLVVGAVLMIAELMMSAFAPSVGHLAAGGDSVQKTRVFQELNLLAFWLYGGASLMFLALLNDFVTVWLGADFVLSNAALAALVLNFYIAGVVAPVGVFRTATGLFRDTQLVLLLSAILNIVFSVALGSVFGLAGILFATALARLLTQVWFEPLLLFKRHFAGRLSWYFARAGGGAALIGSVAYALEVAFGPPPTTWLSFATEAATVALVTAAVVLAVSWPTKAFASLKTRGRFLMARGVEE